MNKVEKELQAATDVEPKKGEDRGEYLTRLGKAVAKLDEKEWDKLSADAQAWYNDNAEARNKAKKADKDVPDFTDFEQEEEKSAGRRRGEDDEPKAKGKDEAPSLDKLEEGQRFKLKTKRGKTIEGVVVENKPKKGFFAYKDKDGDEDEIDYDKVESLEVFHGDAGKDDAGDAEPGVGDEVKLTTKRGKTFTGTITELSGDEVVLQTDDGVEDFARDRVETIAVLKKAKGGGKATSKGDDEDKPRGKGKGDDEPKGKEKDEPKDDGKRTRASNEAGVSVGGKIKELIADNMDASEEEIGKLLKKEKIEFKENTLKLNYVDCHKFLAVLKEKKLLKSGK